MQVRTIDLQNYYLNCIEELQRQNRENFGHYHKTKDEYESKFFHKLFSWKYRDSFYGGSLDSWNSWNMYYIREHEVQLVKLEYTSKMKQELTEIHEDDERQFFQYCKENNLPY